MEIFSTPARKRHEIHLVSIKEKKYFDKPRISCLGLYIYIFLNNSLVCDGKLKCKAKYCCVPSKSWHGFFSTVRIFPPVFRQKEVVSKSV